MVSHWRSLPRPHTLIRRPSAFSDESMVRATLRLTIATPGLVCVSRSSNSRPRCSLMPIARKYPGLTAVLSTLKPGFCAAPSILKSPFRCIRPSGSQLTTPVATTWGSVLSPASMAS
jgi:hypothetical protein